MMLNPHLAQTIEDALLLGTDTDLDHALDQMSQDPSTLAVELRYGIEALRYFRAHYEQDHAITQGTDRHLIARYDADWTMHLLTLVRGAHAPTYHQGLAS